MIVPYLLACLDHMWPVLELEVCHHLIKRSLGGGVRKRIALAVSWKEIGTLFD